jgi:hypothetical protein
MPELHPLACNSRSLAIRGKIVALDRLSNRDPEQAQLLQKLNQALTDRRPGHSGSPTDVAGKLQVNERASV